MLRYITNLVHCCMSVTVRVLHSVHFNAVPDTSPVSEMATTLRKAAQLYRAWSGLGRAYASHSRAASGPAQTVANHVSGNVASPRQARKSYQLLRDLYKLSKGKLSIIVMTTAAGGFVLGSGDTVDFVKLSWTCVGTLACSAAANTCNQVYEIHSDSLMKRTALRPMPTGRMSVPAALAFAAATGLGGAFILQSQVISTKLHL